MAKKRAKLIQVGTSLNKAGDNATADLYLTYERNECPGGDTSSDGALTTSIAKARRVARTNYWLKRYFPLKSAIYNFGLSLSAKLDDGTNLTPEQVREANAKVTEWLDTEEPLASATVDESTQRTMGVASGATVTNRERVTKFIKDCWNEYLLLENLIVGWTQDQKLPYVLPPERCRYKDVMGIETLFFQHGLSQTDLKLLPPAQQTIFGEKSELMFDPDKGSFFKVLKTERTGSGLSWPSIQAMYRAIGEVESMEIGEAAYAYGGRPKWRHWPCGHEIKQGPHAGKNTHFWKRAMATMIRNAVSDKRGHLGDLTTNFDIEVKFPHEPIEYYKEEKWSSVEHRLISWGGPVAEMLIADQQRPFLSQLLRAEVTEAREAMKLFLESVINQAFQLGDMRLEINWSNTIFQDSKTQADLLKFGVTSGPISQCTFREEAGYDDAKERVRKQEEADACKKNPEMFKPAFDAAHGDQADQLDKGGKPAGGTDSDNQTVS